MCRRMTRPWSRSCARQAQSFSARPTCRNLARAPIRAMPFGAQPEIPSTRGSMPAAPRAARRSRSPATCSRFAPAPILAGPCGSQLRSAASWVFPSPGVVPMDGRPLGWTPISVLGPMGRSVADLRLLFSAQIGMDDREPLAFPLDPAAIATARPVDLGRLHVALNENFGKSPVSAEIRRVFRSRIAAMRRLFRTCDEVQFDFGKADDCFDVVRAQSYVDRYRDAYAKDPDSLGPNVRVNYEMAARMTLADMAWAHAEQTRIFRRFQSIFRDYDLVLSPTVGVTPFSWSELYLEELEGERLRNYYHWLALTYFVTLVTNPAISIPCGLDEHAMPFGLQVTGRFHGDQDLLDAAEAMEQAFANIPGLQRPHPDIGKLAEPTIDLKSIATHPPLEAASTEC